MIGVLPEPSISIAGLQLAKQDMLGNEIVAQITKQVITIVIPTLNEAQAIGKVIDELKELGYQNILVVDGYSTDGTPVIATHKGARVINQAGQGKSGALATAVQYVKTPYMLVMDGDWTYDPTYIDRLIAHSGAYDEVIGARAIGRENIPALNRLGNRIISYFFKVMFAVNLTDVCSGMYLIITDAAKRLEFTTGGFDVEVEIAAQFADNERISEVPIKYRPRLGEQKLSSVRHGIRIFTSILRLANFHNPVLLYSALLTLTILPALGILTWVMYIRLFFGQWHPLLAIIGLLLMMFALQSFAVATLALLIKRSEQRTNRNTRQMLETSTEKILTLWPKPDPEEPNHK
jgi:dolichol-phosphate mannosyltransferase